MEKRKRERVGGDRTRANGGKRKEMDDGRGWEETAMIAGENVSIKYAISRRRKTCCHHNI